MNIDNRIHWTHLKTATITVSVSPPPRARDCSGFLFRVSAVADIMGRSRVLSLGQLVPPGGLSRPQEKDESAMAFPAAIGKTQLIYVCKDKNRACSLQKTVEYFYGSARIEKIVSDVLAPGDLVMMKKTAGKDTVTIAGAYRIITPARQGYLKTKNAL